MLSLIHICGIERKGAVPEVFKAMTLRPARRKWQNRIQAVERLNGSFLIHTEDNRIERGLHIKPDHHRRLLFKIWIVAGHIMAASMRLQPGFTPDSGNCLLYTSNAFCHAIEYGRIYSELKVTLH